jgi:branched-chain amino acid transport system ATP-binding protein
MLLLDEPTSGMGREDIGVVAALIKRVATSRTILMVEHNLGFVSDLADTITVLARGEVLAEGTYQQVSSNKEVMAAYIGKPE